MPNPALPALEVEGYELVKHELQNPPADVYFEAYRVHLDNNYVVQIVRSSGSEQLGVPASAGWDEGKWEVNFMRPVPEGDIREALFGQEYEVAEDLNDLTNDVVDDFPLVSNAEPEDVQRILDEVATRPTYERPVATNSDLDQLFATLFGGTLDEEPAGE